MKLTPKIIASVSVLCLVGFVAVEWIFLNVLAALIGMEWALWTFIAVLIVYTWFAIYWRFQEEHHEQD